MENGKIPISTFLFPKLFSIFLLTDFFLDFSIHSGRQPMSIL